MKPSVQIDDSKFRRKVNGLLKRLNKPLEKELPLYTVWFTQSAVKGTPPRGKVSKKRPVIELDTGRFNKKGKEVKRFKVPYRTNKKRGVKYFDKRKEATAFSKIIYRFIGKYAWLAASENTLRTTVNVKMPKVQPEVLAMKNKIGKGVKLFNRSNPLVVIINKAEGIGRYALIATRNALLTTERRILGAKNKRKVKKGYGKLWR